MEQQKQHQQQRNHEQQEYQRSVDIATAVDLNSRGVALLQRNEHSEALLLFNHALCLSRMQPIGAIVGQQQNLGGNELRTAASSDQDLLPRQEQQVEPSPGVSASDNDANMVPVPGSSSLEANGDAGANEDIECEEEADDNTADSDPECRSFVEDEDCSDFEDDEEVEMKEVDGRGPHAYTIPLDDSPAFASETGSSPNNTFRLFNRALDIAMMPGCGGNCRPEVDAVILYNIGLDYHRLGLLSMQSLYLIKALQIYEFSLTIVGACQSESSRNFDLLKLSLCNNMGHIHAHFSTGAEAEHYLKCLHELLVQVMQKESPMGVELDDASVFTSSVVAGLGQLFQFATAA